MSGTDIPSPMRGPCHVRYWQVNSLRHIRSHIATPYAMSGTEKRSAMSGAYAVSGTDIAFPA
eukprot:3707616-Rhodomonas_salina.1